MVSCVLKELKEAQWAVQSDATETGRKTLSKIKKVAGELILALVVVKKVVSKVCD